MYTVYMHITPSDKRYIGITKQTLEQRWKNGLGYETQIPFWRAIVKYGWSNIRHITIAENLTRKEACTLERRLIKEYRTNNPKYGYNQTEGGDGTHGFRYKNPKSEEWRKKVSKSNTGKKRSLEARQKMSKAKLGTHWTEERKLQYSKSQKERGAKPCEKCHIASRLSRIQGVDLYKGDMCIRHFESMQNCADELGVSVSLVSMICNHKMKSNKYDLRRSN